MKACLDFLLFCLNKGMKGTAVKEEGALDFYTKSQNCSVVLIMEILYITSCFK